MEWHRGFRHGTFPLVLSLPLPETEALSLGLLSVPHPRVSSSRLRHLQLYGRFLKCTIAERVRRP